MESWVNLRRKSTGLEVLLADGPSVYSYARQEPLRWTDSEGTQAIPMPRFLPPPPLLPGSTNYTPVAPQMIVDLQHALENMASNIVDVICLRNVKCDMVCNVKQIDAN